MQPRKRGDDVSDILTVTISGPPGDVERILRRLGGEARIGEPARARVTEVKPEPRRLEVVRPSGTAEVSPVAVTTAETATITGDGSGDALPPVAQQERVSTPAPARPPAEKPAKRKAATKPAGPSAADLELLSALNGDLRPAVDIAVQLGIKRTSCGGVARKLDRLVEEGRCARGVMFDGKRGYRQLGPATPLPEPTEESDQTPTPSADLPARAPHLHIRDLMGHALDIAEALALAAKPLASHLLAEQLGLADEDVRDTLRLLIRQGYVTRLDGNVVRYALTDAVVRDEAAQSAGKGSR